MNQDKPIFTPADDDSDKNKPTVAPLVIKDPEDEEKREAEEPKTESKPIDPTPTPSTPEPKPEPVLDPNKDLADAMFPPKKTRNTAKTVTTVIAIAIVFMAIGFAGGFLGFKYSPKLASLIKISADTDNTAATAIDGQPTSTSATPGDVSVWPIYSNTTYLYSLKYPDNWYSQNTDDPTASTVTLTNFAPQSKTNTEIKVEITIQNAGTMDLKTWLDTQSTITQNVATLAKVTISDLDAYQQAVTGTNQSIATYIKQGSNVITVTYTADPGVFTDGQPIYNTILASIKLS